MKDVCYFTWCSFFFVLISLSVFFALFLFLFHFRFIFRALSIHSFAVTFSFWLFCRWLVYTDIGPSVGSGAMVCKRDWRCVIVSHDFAPIAFWNDECMYSHCKQAKKNERQQINDGSFENGSFSTSSSLYSVHTHKYTFILILRMSKWTNKQSSVCVCVCIYEKWPEVLNLVGCLFLMSHNGQKYKNRIDIECCTLSAS